MCERSGMVKAQLTFSALRKELGLTLDEMAARLELSSKGYVSDIERTNRCSVKVALAIEELSGGRIAASSLNPDIGLVEQSRGLAA
jgi:transcriptional regulator with XRE-family HTH domain